MSDDVSFPLFLSCTSQCVSRSTMSIIPWFRLKILKIMTQNLCFYCLLRMWRRDFVKYPDCFFLSLCSSFQNIIRTFYSFDWWCTSFLCGTLYLATFLFFLSCFIFYPSTHSHRQGPSACCHQGLKAALGLTKPEACWYTRGKKIEKEKAQNRKWVLQLIKYSQKTP